MLLLTRKHMSSAQVNHDIETNHHGTLTPLAYASKIIPI